MATPIRRIAGIAPMPGQMTPGGGGTGAPIQAPAPAPVNTKFPVNPAPAPVPGNTGVVPPAQGGAPVPSPQFNPAARDVALRNLATQTQAAPTAPAAAPPSAAVPPSGAPATAAGGPQTPSIPGVTGAPPTMTPPVSSPPVMQGREQQLLAAMPQVGPYMDAIHNAATPEQRAAAIHDLIDAVRGTFGHQGNGQNFRDAREQRRNGDVTPDNSEFSRSFDEFEQADRAANAAAAPDNASTDADAEAQRMRRRRLSRTGSDGGLYTGSGSSVG